MRRARLPTLVVLCVAAVRVAAQSDGGSSLAERSFPENNEVRSELAGIIHAPAFEAAQAPAERYTERATGRKVEFRVVTEGGGLYLLFVNQSQGAFAIENAGSWVIKRSAVDGSFLQAKIFLNGDPDSFVRLFPERGRTRMNLYLFGHPVYRDVIVPLDFLQLLTEPVRRIMDATRSSVEWDLMLPRPHLPEDRSVERMAEAQPAPALPSRRRCDVRSVPFLRFAPDHGYRVVDLKLLLYLLAMREPGSFYIGTVSPPPGAVSAARGMTVQGAEGGAEPADAPASAGESGGAGGEARGGGAEARAAGGEARGGSAEARAAGGEAGSGSAGARAAGGEAGSGSAEARGTITGASGPPGPASRDSPPTPSAAFFPFFTRTDRFTVVVVEQGRRISLEQFVRSEAGNEICLERVIATRNLDHPSVD